MLRSPGLRPALAPPSIFWSPFASHRPATPRRWTARGGTGLVVFILVLLTGGLLVPTGGELTGQLRITEITSGVLVHGFSERDRDLPGGVGFGGWGSLGVGSWTRAELHLSRDVGASDRPGATCEFLEPVPSGCRAERVDYRQSLHRGLLRVELVPAPLGELRFGVGGLAALERTRVRRTGRLTGRTETMEGGVSGVLPSTGVTVSVERLGFLHPRSVIRLQADRLWTRHGACTEAAWRVCGVSTTDRVGFLAGVRFR